MIPAPFLPAPLPLRPPAWGQFLWQTGKLDINPKIKSYAEAF